MSALAPVLSHRGGLWVGWPGLPLERGGAWEAVLDAGYRNGGTSSCPSSSRTRRSRGSTRGSRTASSGRSSTTCWGSAISTPPSGTPTCEVNEKFAGSVLRNSREDGLHLGAGLPAHPRRRVHPPARTRPARIGFFLHIPFPPLDILLQAPLARPDPEGPARLRPAGLPDSARQPELPHLPREPAARGGDRGRRPDHRGARRLSHGPGRGLPDRHRLQVLRRRRPFRRGDAPDGGAPGADGPPPDHRRGRPARLHQGAARAAEGVPQRPASATPSCASR